MSTQLTKQPAASKEMEYVPYGAADSIKLSVEIVKNLIAVPTKRGATCSDRDAIKFMMLCKAQRLNPFAGDAYLIGYDGADGPTFSLITAHVAFLKRAESNPEYDGMKSGIILIDDEQRVTDIEGDFHLPNQTVVGGWATVYFKSKKHPMTKRVRLSRFQKGFGVWKDDPAGMICKVAEADALRSSFPTLLGGLYMKDEINPDGPTIEMVASTKQDKPELGPVKEETVPALGSETGDSRIVLKELLEEQGIKFDDFKTYININGFDKQNGFDAESLSSIEEWPEAACKAIGEDAALMSRIVKKYKKA